MRLHHNLPRNTYGSRPHIINSESHRRRPILRPGLVTCLSQHNEVQLTKPRANAPKNGVVWRLYNVKVPAEADPGKDSFALHPALQRAVEKKIGAKKELGEGAIRLVRKSFDARRVDHKSWVYVVEVEDALARKSGAWKLHEQQGNVERVVADPEENDVVSRKELQGRDTSGPQPGSKTRAPVVVVGSGPAGLFAALELALAGIPVVLCERGQPVEVRGRDIGALMVRRKLNPESNFCYGEGGAGTWSDGKLTTRIGRNEDPVRYVLRVLHELGAPEHILVAGAPHLGTDRLVRILRAFRAQLRSLGVDIRFGTRVAELMVQGSKVTGVRLEDGSELAGERVVLAVGHSARDMYAHLDQVGVAMVPKPFAMGFRIEHPQALIDAIQYGEEDAAEKVMRGKGPMPVAGYRLATTVPAEALPTQGWGAPDSWYTPLYGAESGGGAESGTAAPDRGVFSFCCCPGGSVVPTGTNPEELCINGMSFSKRDSVWANSALVVTVSDTDWAHHVPQHGALAGMQLQRDIEREAARRGGGAFVAPVQRAVDFVSGQASTGTLPSSSYRLGVRAAPLHDLYPPHMTEAFRTALLRFESQMPGILSDQALLHAAETRTSAPVRVERGADTCSTSMEGLHPCGEGAGFAGGIVSAAVDGLHVGRAIAAQLLGTMAEGNNYSVKGGY